MNILAQTDRQTGKQVLFYKLPLILTLNFGLIWIVLGFLEPQYNIFWGWFEVAKRFLGLLV